MVIQPLPLEKLRRVCDPNQFEFETTAELDSVNGIFGQPRGVRALEFGIGIRSEGYNIYVMGETGTGRTTAIRRFLKERTSQEATPWDWVYVHNFKIPHQPRAIEFPAGHGTQFKKQMELFVSSLRDDVPKAFSTEEYEEEVALILSEFELQQDLLSRSLERKARSFNFGIVKKAAGLTAIPLRNGEEMTYEHFATMSAEEQIDIDQTQSMLENDLEELLRKSRQLKQESRRQLAMFDRRVAERAIQHHERALGEMYADHEEVLLYLSEVHDNVLERLSDFRPDPTKPDHKPDMERYAVNMFVDNGKTEGAPVVVEELPNYNNLIGRIEYETRDGAMFTHFTNIRPGSLHTANGGYLVMEATELLTESTAWEALKRSIKTKHIVLRANNTLDEGGRVLAKSIDPEAIPLDIKIILVGSPGLYYGLWEQDEDFTEMFKVKADFSATIPRDGEHEMDYASFIATRCREDKLLHFDRSAVARVIEFGSELAEHQQKLTARFVDLADIVRESCFWAMQAGREFVTKADVQTALNERIYRSNKVENLIDDDIRDGGIMISTSGCAVGQLNGMSVIDIAGYSFGRPSRITARTFAGGGGVVHIEREIDLADPIHNKGVLTIQGYLGGQYAQDYPLSFSASLTFEQSYGEIGGDSASSAELYTLLSSLGNIPLKQGIAVTGSINQLGIIQPIGGVNEKIEGYYRICKQQGLTGTQGMIIPQANVIGLMLHQDVIAAIEAGEFHVWAVETMEQGMEILTGLCAGERDDEGDYPERSVHGIIQAKLLQMSKKEQGDPDSDEDSESEGDDD
ncbi:MAG: Lon protease family protein [Candidatus Promineifilaceae bacterium]